MIKAVIFDMDGLLIDSEPLWEKGEIKVLTKVGVPLTYEMTKQTMGLRSDEVVQYWHHRFPWTGPSIEEVNEELVNTIVELLKAKDVTMPGVHQAIAAIEQLGLPMAVASSSQDRIIQVAMKRLAIDRKVKVIYSAEHEPYGKPHPGVYITTSEKLGVAPEMCVAFEDSPNGVLAAKAAKMKCIAVPYAKLTESEVFKIADKVLYSLEVFQASILNEL